MFWPFFCFSISDSVFVPHCNPIGHAIGLNAVDLATHRNMARTGAIKIKVTVVDLRFVGGNQYVHKAGKIYCHCWQWR